MKTGQLYKFGRGDSLLIYEVVRIEPNLIYTRTVFHRNVNSIGCLCKWIPGVCALDDPATPEELSEAKSELL